MRSSIELHILTGGDGGIRTHGTTRVHRISSAGRYNHFDTSPCSLVPALCVVFFMICPGALTKAILSYLAASFKAVFAAPEGSYGAGVFCGAGEILMLPLPGRQRVFLWTVPGATSILLRELRT